jgi:TolB-like protein
LKTEARKRMFGLVMLVPLVFVAAGAVMADEPSRVVIVPFKMHADRDLSFLKEGILDMLTLRLSSEDKVKVVSRQETDKLLKAGPEPVNEAAARAFGESLQADYVVFGSLTIFGSSVSLDCKMVDVLQKRPTLDFFRQDDNIDQVIPQIGQFAAEARQSVLGTPISSAPPVAEAPPEPPSTYAHPETLMAGESKAGAKVSTPEPAPERPLAEPGATTQPDMTTPDGWMSQPFKCAIVGMALGDVDGDAKTEVVFISDRQVYVYRLENQRLVRVKEMDGKRSQGFLGVDVADINGNGYAEIFVTSLKGAGQALDSFVLEWDGHDLRRINEDSPWYYRVIDMPFQGKVLLGQKRTLKDLFVPGVYRLAWQDGEYRPQEPLTLPTGTNIFGFALGDVMNNGQQMTVAFDRDEHIRIFGPSGEEEWISDEAYGGTMNYLEFTSLTDPANKDRFYLPPRVYIHDLDGDGKNEVVVASNQGALGRRLSTLRMLNSGRMVGLSWDRLGLSERGQTRKIKGYISDYAIGDLDNDGRKEVVVAQVGKEGTIIKHDRSSIVAYSGFTQLASAR